MKRFFQGFFGRRSSNKGGGRPKHFLDRVVEYLDLRGLPFRLQCKRIAFASLVSFSALGSVFLLYVLVQIPFLPSVEQLKSYVYELPTTIYDNQGKEVHQFFDKKRELLQENDLPTKVVEALIASEDSRFYDHYGIDPIRILKALWVNVTQFSISQGASTITQQTAKLFFLTPEKSLKRKVNEALLALKLEQNFTKQQILTFYLNQAFFGRQSYGIESAAKTYFNKKAKDLTFAEAATLIGLLPAPSKYSPTVNLARSKERRDIVLAAMEKNGFLTEQEKLYQQSLPIELKLGRTTAQAGVSFYAEEIRRYLIAKYGVDKVMTGGLKVYTAMDANLQYTAQTALEDGLMAIEKRHGYRGPLARGTISDKQQNDLDDAMSNNDYSAKAKVVGQVLDVTPRYARVKLGEGVVGLLNVETAGWAFPYSEKMVYTSQTVQKNLTQVIKTGDYLELRILKELTGTNLPFPSGFADQAFEVELYPTPYHNGAALVVNLKNGYVLALSGGYSFGQSQFNRVTQSRRQIGSAFKPFVYLTALLKGYTTSSILDDSPVVYENLAGGTAWVPKNYGETFTGYMTLRDALVYSKNIPTIKLASDIGIESVINTAKLLGIDTSLYDKNLSIALGSGSASLWELLRAYSVFPNNGDMVDLRMILKVEDRDGRVLESNDLKVQEKVIPSEQAFILNSILQDVNTRGTGGAARGLAFASGGKTGTTNNDSNAWYVGYSPDIIAGVYIGNDSPSITLGKAETGGRAALPIWLRIMQAAAIPRSEFSVPESLERKRVSYRTGKLICDEGSQEGHLDYYIKGTEPTECDRFGIDGLKSVVIQSDEDIGTHAPAENGTASETAQKPAKNALEDQL